MPVPAIRKRIPHIQPWEVIILLAIIFFVMTICITHANTDLAPPSNDDAWYLAESFEQYSTLSRAGMKHFFWPLIRSTPDKPPLITLLPLLVFPFVSMASIATAKYVLAFSLALIALYTFLLARRHIKAPGAFIAAMLAVSTPMTIVLSQRYFAEVPTMACLLAFAYYIDKCELLDDQRATFYAGLCFGLGVLLKLFFFFMGGALIILVLVYRFREEAELRKMPGVAILGGIASLFIGLAVSVILGLPATVLQAIVVFIVLGVIALAYFGKEPWRNFLSTAGPGAAVAMLIAGPWYIANGQTALKYFFKYALGPQIPSDPFNVPPIPIWHFAQVLINDTFGLFLILLAAGFGIWAITRLRSIREHLPPLRFWLLLALWGILPLLVFAVPSRRIARVLLPVVPAFAIGVGVIIGALLADRNEKLFKIIAVSIGILAAANIYYVSFGPRGGGLTVGPFYLVRDPNPPDDRRWMHASIHHLIQEKRSGLRQLLVLRHTPTMNRNALYCVGSLWNYRNFDYLGYHDWKTGGYRFPGEKQPESGKAISPGVIKLAGMFIIDERIKGENNRQLPAGVAEFRARLETAVKAGYAWELSSNPYENPNGSVIHVWAISE